MFSSRDNKEFRHEAFENSFSIVTQICHHPKGVTVKKDYKILTSSCLIFSSFCSPFLIPFMANYIFYFSFVREDEATTLQFLWLSLSQYGSLFLLIPCNHSPNITDLPEVTLLVSFESSCQPVSDQHECESIWLLAVVSPHSST